MTMTKAGSLICARVFPVLTLVLLVFGCGNSARPEGGPPGAVAGQPGGLPQPDTAAPTGGGPDSTQPVGVVADRPSQEAGPPPTNPVKAGGGDGRADAPRELELPGGPVHAVAVSRDGKWVMTGDDKAARLWDAGTGKEVRRFEGHDGEVAGVAFSPDGWRAATAGADRTVRVWDMASGKELYCFRGHRGRVRAVAFSPDGRRVASGGQDRRAVLWEADGGKVVLGVDAHGDLGALTVDVSPDGRQLAVGSSDGAVRLWDVETGKEVRRLAGLRACFAGNGRVVYASRLKTGTRNVNWVKVWDARTDDERELGRTEGVSGLVWSLAVSPDGRYVAAGGGDGVVRVWEVQAPGREPETAGRHTGRVSGLAFFPDGRRLASGGERDKGVRVWALAK